MNLRLVIFETTFPNTSFAFGPCIAIKDRLSSKFNSYLSSNFFFMISKSCFLHAAFRIIK